MDGLKEFEDSLQASLRRQMLAIKSSAVMNLKGEDDEAHQHKPVDNAPESLTAVQQQMALNRGKSSKRDQNSNMIPGEMDGPQDREIDEDGEVEETEAAKREGARPPPVNSPYLPLPWKGRLGYVRFLPWPAPREIRPTSSR